MRKKSESRIYEYDVLRLLTTLLVVIGHGKYYLISTPYGGCNYVSYVDTHLVGWKIITHITNFIYDFHMPLFMALGGAVFYCSYAKNRFKTLSELAQNKFKRLLIPFFVVGLLFSFPIKYATGYFADSRSVLADWFLGQFLLQGNTHLWYLPAIFFVFLIIFLIEKHCSLDDKWKLLLFLICTVLSPKISIKIISYVLQYLFWFFLGYCFEKKRAAINEKIGVLPTVFVCFLSCVLYVLNMKLGAGQTIVSKLVKISFGYFLTISACLATYMISFLLSKTKITSCRIYEILLRDTFGIYLYSDPVNYIILLVASVTAPDFWFAVNAGVGMLYLIRIAVTLVISVVISELLRSRKIQYIV